MALLLLRTDLDEAGLDEAGLDEAGLDEAGLRRELLAVGRFETFFLERVLEADFLLRVFVLAFFARFFGARVVLARVFFACFLVFRRLAAISRLRSRAPR